MKSRDASPVLETNRLLVYVAGPQDAAIYFDLWTNPQVMRNVGYPEGLPITYEEVKELLKNRAGRILDTRLIVILKETGEAIGECKLGTPDAGGISETDVKLFPAYWGYKYGIEVKRALVDYLFRNTECTAVQATPNVKNIASIKMQEAVGGVREGDQIFASDRPGTIPVHAYIYRVYRDNWS